ncbi:MAG: hypothetical protein Q4C18_04675 [Eubacteriales bacterium]|nr:hypothetical protein [Eubacteriales bacterium]
MNNNEKIFINYSNHPSNRWNPEQRAAAEKYGRIVDMEFHKVSMDEDERDIEWEAYAEYCRIMALHPVAVMCQGEFTLTYVLIQLLQQAGVTVLAACSERKVEESIDAEFHLPRTGNSVDRRSHMGVDSNRSGSRNEVQS